VSPKKGAQSNQYRSPLQSSSSQMSLASSSQSQSYSQPMDFCGETGAIARPLTSESLLWVDKYKPTEIRQIIGQQGDKSNAKKLLSWLQHWRENYNKKPACKNSIYNTRSIIGRFCDVNYLYVHIVKKQSFL